MDNDLKAAVEFHGHLCPGLAIGYRVAKYVKEHYPRSEDEELVCIAENRSCSVDAVQQMLGCTAGKGNLIFKDHGKQVFTFFSRDDGQAIRIYFKGDLSDGMDEIRSRYFKGELSEKERAEFEIIKSRVMERIIRAPDEELLSVSAVQIPPPKRAQIHPTLGCQECGEGFMEILGRTVNGKVVCLDCFEKLTERKA